MSSSQRNALVVGGRGLLGRAAIDKLREHKITTHIWSIDRTPPPQENSDGITELTIDIRDADAPGRLAEILPSRVSTYVSALGGEDAPPVEPVEDAHWPPPSVWDDITLLNIGLSYRLLHALQSKLLDGASITHISSIAANIPWVVSPAYGASKASLEHWTTSLAVLLAPRGIRVNAVRPGFVWSRQWAAVTKDEFDAVVENRVILAQYVNEKRSSKEQLATDVGESIAFLASDRARHLTGQFFDVDGGASLVRAAR